jgi:hypothetical protein
LILLPQVTCAALRARVDKYLDKYAELPLEAARSRHHIHVAEKRRRSYPRWLRGL